MAAVTEMRTYLKTLYPNNKWAKKVDAMPNQQVYAVYMDAIRKQNAREDAAKQAVVQDTPAPELPEPEQLSLNL